MIRVTIWNEFRHEKTNEKAKALYPNGIHGFIKEFLDESGEFEVTLASLDDENQGLPDEVLNNTDVLVWWGHKYHHEVNDALVAKIKSRVYTGDMGFVALHSAHRSKPFTSIIGTNGNLGWGREQKEIIWNMMPSHPIAEGIPDHFILESEEMYSEPFYIPCPDALVFGSWFEDGHIFRSGACFIRGAGKVFYFQPGHETRAAFYNPYVQRIIANGIKWACPQPKTFVIDKNCIHFTTPVINEFSDK